ncbi:hypothetical protein ACFL35_06540 [Candidatus Riflebacteria bacterium]
MNKHLREMDLPVKPEDDTICTIEALLKVKYYLKTNQDWYYIPDDNFSVLSNGRSGNPVLKQLLTLIN